MAQEPTSTAPATPPAGLAQSANPDARETGEAAPLSLHDNIAATLARLDSLAIEERKRDQLIIALRRGLRHARAGSKQEDDLARAILADVEGVIGGAP